MKVLSGRALTTSAIDLTCIVLVLLGSNSYHAHGALPFTLKIGIASVLFNFVLFLTFLPGKIIYFFCTEIEIFYYIPQSLL